ncbi:MAG: HEAT repeat domain-containing protein [Bacteroidota bacterium]
MSGQAVQVWEIILLFAVLVFALALLLVFIILRKSFSRQESADILTGYRATIDKKIAIILVDAMENSSEGSYYNAVKGLTLLVQKYPVLEQYVLDTINRQYGNLVGDSKTVLKRLYADLSLHQISLKKLENRSWHVQAVGIRELEKMDQSVSVDRIFMFINAKKSELRKVARLALTKLETGNLTFLDHLDEELSEWEQLAMHERLKNRAKTDLPDFSKYYFHEQNSVVEFSIKMTVEFGFYELVPQLITLLKASKNHRIKLLTVQALTRLEAYQAVPLVRSLLQSEDSAALSIACLNFLGNIDDLSSQWLIEMFMSKEDMEIRMAAVNAAIKLRMEFSAINQDIENILLHFENELIS